MGKVRKKQRRKKKKGEKKNGRKHCVNFYYNFSFVLHLK